MDSINQLLTTLLCLFINQFSICVSVHFHICICFYICICLHLKVSTSHCPCRRRVVCHESSSHSWGRGHSPRKQTNTENLISMLKDDYDHLEIPMIEYFDSGIFLKASPPLESLQRGALSPGWRIPVRKSQSCVQHCPALANACNAWSANVEATYWTMYLMQKILKWLLVDCLQIGHVWVHVEVKEAKSKARLCFPERRVGLKRSQVECVILHLA